MIPSLRYTICLVMSTGIAALVTYILVPVIIRLSKRYDFMDHPGYRKIHDRPVPNIGGLALLAGITAALACQLILWPRLGENTRPIRLVMGVLAGSAVVTLFGLWDDLYGMKPSVKLLFQALTGLLMVGFGFQLERMTIPLAGSVAVPLWVSVIVSVGWFVILMNAFNLIDGLDGLANGTGAIVAVTFLIITMVRRRIGEDYSPVISVALLGASLGFIRYNRYPARIFLGDSGSMLIGFILAAVGMIGIQKSVTTVALFIPVSALLIPLLDTVMAVSRRIRNRQNIFIINC